MAYQNNNRNTYGNNYGNNRNYGNGYNQSQNNGYSNNRGNGGNIQPKKHSGCKKYKWFPKDGPNKGQEMHGVLGWRFRKGIGLMKYKANMTSKSKVGDNGWCGSVAVEIIAPNAQKSFYWATMHVPTGKVVIGDLGEVMSPQGGKGGYVGTFIR